MPPVLSAREFFEPLLLIARVFVVRRAEILDLLRNALDRAAPRRRHQDRTAGCDGSNSRAAHPTNAWHQA
jgi:hypothetical protein